MFCWFFVVYWCYVSVRPPWSVNAMPLLVPYGDSLLWCLEGFRSSPSHKSVFLHYFLRIFFYSFCGDLFVNMRSGYASALQISSHFLATAQDDSMPSISSKLLLPVSILLPVFNVPNAMAP